MAEESDRIIAIIYEAIDDVNDLLSDERQVAKSPEAVLFGPEAGLDSISLVNLIVAVEQGIEDEFGTTLVLANEKAMSRRTSPFRTVATLSDYIASQLAEATHG